jgi:hypothetical protein
MITDMGGGVIDIMAVGTAVRRLDGIAPATPTLMAQAVIVDRESVNLEGSLQTGAIPSPSSATTAGSRMGCFVVLFLVIMTVLGTAIAVVAALLSR